MKRKCYLCESDEARICFPSDKRQLRRWVFLLKCQVTLPNQAYSFCISKKLCRRSYLFNASSSPFQAPPRVGNSGPRLCLKHFHKEDIVDTGVKLKKNACPQSTTSIPGASSVTNDMILVSSDGFHIPTNISVIISVSPILKNILSDFHYQTYEESMKTEGDVHPGQGPQSGPLSAPSAAEDTDQPRGPGHRLRESSHQRSQGGHGCL